SEAATQEAKRILAKFEKSTLAKNLRRAEILGREIPFTYSLQGQVVRGAIDLICRRKGKIWIIDFKTDSVKQEDLRKKATIYRQQMEAYAEAVCRALEISEAGYSLVFLRLARRVDGIFRC